MVEDIDYQVVARMLQEENEKLRILILKQRTHTMPEIDLSTIKEFVEENYILLIVAFSLLSLLFTVFFSTVDVMGRYQQRKNYHEG